MRDGAVLPEREDADVAADSCESGFIAPRASLQNMKTEECRIKLPAITFNR